MHSPSIVSCGCIEGEVQEEGIERVDATCYGILLLL